MRGFCDFDSAAERHEMQDILTYDDVEARLVEAMRLWHRSPGEGRWPYAGDAPWHLMQREAHKGDYDARGGDMAQTAPRALPLDRDEVDERDLVSNWLRHVKEADRRIVVLAITHLASGAARVPWVQVRDQMGIALGAGGVQRRYSKALTSIARGENRVAMVAAGGDVVRMMG